MVPPHADASTGALANDDHDAEIPRSTKLAVLVATLGYLVDIYDLILFSVVRTPSLRAIGVPADQLGDTGLLLINAQMLGMLLGGIAWGVLGDKRGRLSVLFGSILMYSLANIANGFVTDVTTYAWLRLIAGIGLAGELGAGVTLVMELLSPRMRGWATTAIAGIGICGALLAVAISKIARSSDVSRGNFFALFAKWDRLKRYLAIILVGVPVWYAIGILVTFSTEIGAAMGMPEAERPDPGIAVACAYSGLAIGDFAAGIASQLAKSRKRALLAFCVMNIFAVLFYFTLGKTSQATFYVGCVLLGIANGYWAVFVTVASEQFGTNLRATATTTAPNFVRGSLVPVSVMYVALRGVFGGVGVGEPLAAIVVGAIVISLSIVSLAAIDETYGKNLDFVET
jgi:putative MFS transporter